MPAPSSTLLALQSLLSTQSVPPKLVSHADSLLNLSRQRAANLKSEEEIARAHACAEIAAKRLRLSLRLPSIKSGAGAPAKPGVYNKLLKFLERQLDDVGGTATTPTSGKKRSATSNAATPKSGAKRAKNDSVPHDEVGSVPNKKRKTSDFLGKIKSVAANGSLAQGDASAPDYVMPSIRLLCRALETTTLTPHIFTGVSVILREAMLWPAGEDHTDEEQQSLKERTTALIIAVYLMVLTRMKKGKMTASTYTLISTKGMEVFNLQLRDEYQAKVQDWIGQINAEGWASDKDWWQSIPENVIQFPAKSNGEQHQDESESSGADYATGDGKRPRSNKQRLDVRKQFDKPDPEGVLLPGLGTMMQEAVDFQSEDRRTEQQIWKADLERRMNALDKQAIRQGRAVAVR